MKLLSRNSFTSCAFLLYTFLIESMKLRLMRPKNSVDTCGMCSDLQSRTVSHRVFCGITCLWLIILHQMMQIVHPT